MSYRVIHSISGECDVFISKTEGNHVRVRITESDPEHPSPTDFEIEGTPSFILEAMGTIVDVLTNIEALNGEVN
jgi:hypothetical protein